MPLHRNALHSIIALVGIALSSAPVQAEAPTARSAGQPEVRKQWTPDAGLQSEMDAIRRNILGIRAEIMDSRLDSAAYRRLAASLEVSTNALSKQQSVSDAARKAFHTIVLGDLRWGVETMQMSPKADVQRLGALSVIQALKNYGQFFAHPGWDTIP